MKLNILINGALYSSQASYSALQFCNAEIKGHHQISQVFFQQDAAAHGNTLTAVMSDEPDVVGKWARFSEVHSVPLIICVSAAERRGVLSAAQAEEFAKPAANLHSAFSVAGLGALHEASLASDRTVSFS